MSRLRKTDPEMAVQAAMALFWQHGYGDLGTRQLEEETGITRFTLQTTYGGKMPLFLTALDTYLDAFEAHACPAMQDGKLETIASWFEARSNPSMYPEFARNGCFLLNASVEFLGESDEVNQRVDRFYTMVRAGFVRALTAVNKQGGVAESFDINAMAEVLLAAAIAMNIVIRSARDNTAGAQMAGATAQLIRGWAVA